MVYTKSLIETVSFKVANVRPKMLIHLVRMQTNLKLFLLGFIKEQD